MSTFDTWFSNIPCFCAFVGVAVYRANQATHVHNDGSCGGIVPACQHLICGSATHHVSERLWVLQCKRLTKQHMCTMMGAMVALYLHVSMCYVVHQYSIRLFWILQCRELTKQDIKTTNATQQETLCGRTALACRVSHKLLCMMPSGFAGPNKYVGPYSLGLLRCSPTEMCTELHRPLWYSIHTWQVFSLDNTVPDMEFELTLCDVMQMSYSIQHG